MEPIRLQRRIATILATDVAGYSRMMAEDEEATLRTLKSFRTVIDALIARHDGRIFNTAGDSVLAEFDSAVEAVRCAISIQEEIRARNEQLEQARRMMFRIGINVGDVMVDSGNMYGDGVNVAARLEGIAQPGGICLSGSTVALVRNKLNYAFEDIGPQSVKNIPEPVPAFRLTAGGAAETTARPSRGPSMFKRRTAVIASIAIAALAAAGGALWLSWPDRGLSTENAARRPAEGAPAFSQVPKATTSELERMKPLVGMTIHGVSFRRNKPYTVVLGPDGQADAEIEDVPSPGDTFRDRGRWWVTDYGALCWRFPRFAAGEMRCRRLVKDGNSYRGVPREERFGAWTIKR